MKQRVSEKLDRLTKVPAPTSALSERLPADASFPTHFALSGTVLVGEFVASTPPHPFRSDAELCRREVGLENADASVLRFCDGAKYAVRVSFQQLRLSSTPEVLVSGKTHAWFDTRLAFTLVSLDGALARREDRALRLRRTDLNGPDLALWNASLVDDALGRWRSDKSPRSCPALDREPAAPLPCACVECESGRRCIVTDTGAPVCVVG